LKKGCFVKVIVVLTIFTAAVLYIAQNHFDEFFLEPGRGIIKGFFISELDNEFAFVKNNPEKDSLKILLTNFIESEIDSSRNISNKQFDWLVDSIKIIISDSLVTPKELNQMRELLSNKFSK
jgi:hypothetical protein